jgi:hypothetical protein
MACVEEPRRRDRMRRWMFIAARYFVVLLQAETQKEGQASKCFVH